MDRADQLWKWHGAALGPKPQLEGSPEDTGAALERLCEGLGVAFERVAEVIREMVPAVGLMVSHFSVLTEQGWQTVPASSMRVPDDAPPPTTGRTWTMQVESPHRELLDVLYGGTQWDDQRRIFAPGNPGVSWPDEGYPCQLCWAAGRWPWEPARVCPLSVPVESTYCARHRA